jgi:serine/threonine protein kinase
MDKDQIVKEDAMTLVFRERIMLQQFNHPFIVGIKYCFQDDDNLFIGLEFARGGDLRFSMNTKHSFDDTTLSIYVAEMSSAIAYMHSLMVVHRDLKPENLLLDDGGHILITDLNLATSLKKRKPTSRFGTLSIKTTFPNVVGISILYFSSMSE